MYDLTLATGLEIRKNFYHVHLDKTISKHYIFGQPYLLFNETHVLKYNFKSTHGDGHYEPINEQHPPAATTTRLEYEQFYAEIVVKEHADYVYIDNYAFPKNKDGKRICFALTDETIKYKYFSIADETDFILDCSRMAAIPKPIIEPYLIEQFKKIGLDINDVPIVQKKNYSIDQVIHSELTRVKKTNFTMTPMHTFNENQTLSEWIVETQASFKGFP